MAKYMLVITVFLVSAVFISINGDEDYSQKVYNPLPFRNDRGLNIFGGKAYVRSLPDLVNLVFGLKGHIAGRAGWIVHDAVRSLFEGFFTSKYKLLRPPIPSFGNHMEKLFNGIGL